MRLKELNKLVEAREGVFFGKMSSWGLIRRQHPQTNHYHQNLVPSASINLLFFLCVMLIRLMFFPQIMKHFYSSVS